MAELYPAPFATLLRRMKREWDTNESIFDLKAKSFYRGDPDLDISIRFLGRPASTPVGPAAGPQSQLAQNIVLSWLGGARVIELKTVQIMDQLDIPRPCIYAGNIGFNVEWSQELRLADSLREYVKASMMIDMLRDSRIVGERPGPDRDDTVFDMSVGYDLKGIQSPEIMAWIEGLRDATKIVDELRSEIPDEWSRYRDFDFKTRIAETITLSTFHGCPADEIEKIVHFLVTEMGIDTVIKLNPTLLGKPRVDHLLNELMGYAQLSTTQDAFEKDLHFPDALGIVRRLTAAAGQAGRTVGVKFTNTLVVQNHQKYFTDPVMYLSGPPLHVISMTLAQELRRALGFDLPVSFSAGIDRKNFSDAVACGFTPITTCTDLLKTGGYGRLSGYLSELEGRMKGLGTSCIEDYIVMSEGLGKTAIQRSLEPLAVEAVRLRHAVAGPSLADGAAARVASLEADLLSAVGKSPVDLSSRISRGKSEIERALGASFSATRFPDLLDGLHGRIARAAALENMGPIVGRVQASPRYGREKNQVEPRKIGSQLYLFDCINCDKCVPVCPNDANFTYDIAPLDVTYPQLEMTEGGVSEVGESRFQVEKSHQIANFSDFCNECGNCDTYCPEDGGPFVVKPRFFGSLEYWKRHDDHDGFVFLSEEGGVKMYGRIEGQEYELAVDQARGVARFTDSRFEVELACGTGEVSQKSAREGTPKGHRLDLSRYYIMKSVFDGVMDLKQVNYINAAS